MTKWWGRAGLYFVWVLLLARMAGFSYAQAQLQAPQCVAARPISFEQAARVLRQFILRQDDAPLAVVRGSASFSIRTYCLFSVEDLIPGKLKVRLSQHQVRNRAVRKFIETIVAGPALGVGPCDKFHSHGEIQDDDLSQIIFESRSSDDKRKLLGDAIHLDLRTHAITVADFSRVSERLGQGHVLVCGPTHGSTSPLTK